MKRKAHELTCLKNMGQLTEAHFAYATDHDGSLPLGRDYITRKIEDSVIYTQYVGGEKRVFRCPLDDGGRRQNSWPWGRDLSVKPPYFSYVRNGMLHGILRDPKLRLSEVNQIQNTTFLFEEWEEGPMNDSYVVPNSWDLLTQRHDGQGGMSFLDGHVEMVDAIEFNQASRAWRVNKYLRPE